MGIDNEELLVVFVIDFKIGDLSGVFDESNNIDDKI